MSTATATADNRDSKQPAMTISRIGVGVDGFSEGRDAAALGALLAEATGAELMLIAVQPEPLVVLPSGMDWKSERKHAEAGLAQIRDRLAPGARTVVETDLSVARALQRVVRREHRDLLVLGSSRHSPDGRVRIGKRTRQLLCQFESMLAVAPQGLHKQEPAKLSRIGVGYDGGPEAELALKLAGSLAVRTGAELHVITVLDDRMPALGWPRVWVGELLAEWQTILADEQEKLTKHAMASAGATGAQLHVEALRGKPADRLLELSPDLDLIVIGSRRWGPVARLMLGSTGEALMHDCAAPVLVVPRPRG